MSLPYRRPERPPRDPLDLGPLQLTFRGRRGVELYFGIFFMACAALLLWQFADSFGDRPPSLAWKIAVHGGLASLCTLLGLVCLRPTLHALGTRVALHEHGFEVRLRGFIQRMRWDEIASVATRSVQVAARVVQHTTVARRAGDLVEVPAELVDSASLTRELHERSAAALLPEARTRFAEGRRVDFGPVSVSQAGLEHAGRTWPWREVGTPSLVGDQLAIVVSGARVSTDRGGVPNLRVLLELCELGRATVAPQAEANRDA